MFGHELSDSVLQYTVLNDSVRRGWAKARGLQFHHEENITTINKKPSCCWNYK